MTDLNTFLIRNSGSTLDHEIFFVKKPWHSRIWYFLRKLMS